MGPAGGPLTTARTAAGEQVHGTGGRLLSGALLCLLAVLVWLPHAVYERAPGDVATAAGSASIAHYEAVFDVDERGDMEVAETVVVDVPESGASGVTRVFDEYDARSPRTPRVPRRFSLVRDGTPESWSLVRRDAGRSHVVRMGKEGARLEPGLHSYVISYEVEDVLRPDTDGAAVLHWDLLDAGRRSGREAARLTVNLPAPAGQAECRVGAGPGDAGGERPDDRATDGSCVLEGIGTSSLLVVANDVGPRTPVTLRVRVADLSPADGRALPWSADWSPVLGGTWWLLGLVVAAAGWAGSFGYRAAAGVGRSGGLLVLLAGAAAAVLALAPVLWPDVGHRMSALALVPGAFAVLGAPMLLAPFRPSSGPQNTLRGRN